MIVDQLLNKDPSLIKWAASKYFAGSASPTLEYVALRDAYAGTLDINENLTLEKYEIATNPVIIPLAVAISFVM